MSTRLEIITTDESTKRIWDVVVIGSGVGGATAAYSLTKQGLSVLLVEKGKSDLLKSDAVRIDSPEDSPQARIDYGKWPTPITTVVDGIKNDIWAPLGCGIGGSSRWYAAALTRLEPADFGPELQPSGQEISWPIAYSEIEPYYENAEQLYRVSGTPDPLGAQSEFGLVPPPAMCDLDRHFFQSFRNCGMNPYRIHLGLKYVNGCQGCGGKLCPNSCKQDAYESCIKKANSTGNLFVLDQSEALEFRSEKDLVTALKVVREDTEAEIKSRIFVLAAGAYFSPVILKNSKSEDWPQGLGNQNDQVGRNLMFHVSEFIAMWPKGNYDQSGLRSTIALRDFYKYEGEKYGELQSTGMSAGLGNILYFLHSVFNQTRLSKYSFLRHFLRIPAYIASKLFKDATVFACAIEDFPYPENRIVTDTSTASGLRVDYTIHSELENRALKFRKLLRKNISSNYMYPLNIKPALNFGHACGTCSAGVDPKSSVVDADCKVHGVNNLYIVDASIMPKSGGANPSLTIAANALRVSDNIVRVLQSSAGDR